MMSVPARPCRGVVLAALAVWVCGCADPGHAVGFEEADNAARLRAVRRAAAERDRSAIWSLIERLRSDDPAERLFSIRTLEQITGTTLGYDHASGPRERDAAVERWRQWADSGRAQTPRSDARIDARCADGRAA